ncbi:hypothetical protein CTA2_8707 [Colletotrichum tanaceti]|uniref:MYND-type domain-containing protein n=1 Tax=Colletotrichum tanaceti TaxID=1306861 RepID=A0A4V6DGS3_9PEZI|nr:hypothetical protein CTA2_8707 [Colletotrichum tanaceti]TKW53816.1 hypothetical protein CTA1_5924 [Colletotrichum tanaceti]
MTTTRPLCANLAPDKTNCKKVARIACNKCFLVAYCNSECQRSHKAAHKSSCKSSLRSKTWQPDWVLKNRIAAFFSDGPRQMAYGGGKYLWGNVPAIDVLQLEANEGGAYDGNLRLLFAASGDLRNVIKTVAQLPESYTQTVEATLNDRDLDIVARNAILLLIALVMEDFDASANCIIHVWYSAFLRKCDLDVLQQRIRPLIEEVCHKLTGQPADKLLAKTWTYGQRSLRLVLQKSAWDALLAFTDTPKDLTTEQARKLRTNVTLAEDRVDFRDRHFFLQTPSHRVAMVRFREDGLLLPFGASHVDFQHPNPTMFQDTERWPMKDDADPLHGWSSKDVQAASNGPASDDIYGKLFVHVQTLLGAFLRRLSGLRASFQLFQMDASDVPGHLEAGSYTRIEVSNISDACYLGTHRTLHDMVPLLQSPAVNPHATLITLSMNVVEENLTILERYAGLVADGPTWRQIQRYMPLPRRELDPNDPVVCKILAAQDCVTDYDVVFSRFSLMFGLFKSPWIVGAAMKREHTVIEKWPFRLKLQPGQPGAQAEFNRLIGGGVSSKEFYLEWKRV